MQVLFNIVVLIMLVPLELQIFNHVLYEGNIRNMGVDIKRVGPSVGWASPISVKVKGHSSSDRKVKVFEDFCLKVPALSVAVYP